MIFIYFLSFGWTGKFEYVRHQPYFQHVEKKRILDVKWTLLRSIQYYGLLLILLFSDGKAETSNLKRPVRVELRFLPITPSRHKVYLLKL